NGNLVVKGCGGQAYEQSLFKDHSLENLKRGLKMVVVQQLNSPVVQFIMSFAMAIVIWIALRPEILRDTSAGEFVAYITAAGMLSKQITALIDVNEILQYCMATTNSICNLHVL